MTWRLIFILLVAIPAGAVCHVVTPSGSGGLTGADWNNAFAGLPATLVRGDIYFLADGTYPRYNFNTANSGSTVITVKKAISGDHCTDTGYNNATMGSAQAVFGTGGTNPIWQFNSSSFWTITGQARTGLKTGYGILLDNSGGSNGRSNGATVANAINFSGTSSTHITNITISFVEIAGGGVGNSGDSFSITAISRASNVVTATYSGARGFLADSSTVVGSQIAVTGVADATYNTSNSRVTASTATTVSYANSGANGSSSGGTLAGALNLSEFDYRYAGCVDTVTIDHFYLHDSSDTPLQGDGSFAQGCVPSNMTFDHGDVARNRSNNLRHSEGWADQGSNSSTSIDPNGKNIFRYNVFEDLEGTGYLVTVGATCNTEIYGNVIVLSNGNPFFISGIGNGVISTTSSSAACGTWLVHNNSVINTSVQGFAGTQIVSTGNIAAGATATVTANNNVCYFPDGSQCGYSASASVPVTHDWTGCFTTGTCPTETHVQTSTANPFVNWPNGNYHLTSDTVTNTGNTLASPYNTDPDGLTRGADGTWDRGAFEFGSGGSCSPVISSVTLNPTSVTGGTNSTGTATISCAPSVNTAVALSSSNTAVATVPATVTVLSGQTTATFTATTVPVCLSTNVTITATLGGSTTAALTVTVGGGQCQGANVIGTAKVSGTAVVQ